MDISIIIVNFNTKNLLKNCLNSIYGTVHNLSYEIIVVDNASSDGSPVMVRAEFPQVYLIENDQNRGFGAANNQALLIMRGRYALLLNTDTILTENAVSELLSFMESHPDAAMACGQLLNADGSKQNSVAPFPSIWTLLFNLPLLEKLFPKKYPSKRYDYKNPLEVDSGIGACLLVRRHAINEVSLFDERYFFFFEETDWALRMKNAGWKVYHVPSAHINHLQGQSIGHDIHSRIEFYRSRYQFFRKWNAYSYYLVITFIIFFRLIINWVLTSIANVLTIGLSREMRNKSIIYSQLILWHLRGRP
ncbi:MAG: glycosyltransferase family 2 protein [Thermodesulfobacteriota bacterium]|nr:glycosyltransferase family 2 protein [Thermodesulfobacteriota bacterium]